MPGKVPEDAEAQVHAALGRTLWELQAFEETLARLISIVFKIPAFASITEARVILESARSAPLGRLIVETKKLVPMDAGFELFLSRFLEQRNWLVHRSRRTHGNFGASEQDFIDLTYRIQRLSMDALEFNEFFSKLVLDWAHEKGISAAEIDQMAQEVQDAFESET